MNVYDFDKTIFYPDSNGKFAFYCMRHHPLIYFKFMPRVIKIFFKYIFKKADIIGVNVVFLSFIKYLKNPNKDIKNFWDKYQNRIKQWYLKIKREDDLIISASPSYLIKPICDRLNVKCIATNVDIKSGQVIGHVCYGDKKAINLKNNGIFHIDNFYSNSLSDECVAKLSDHPYLVIKKGNKIIPWNFK